MCKLQLSVSACSDQNFLSMWGEVVVVGGQWGWQGVRSRLHCSNFTVRWTARNSWANKTTSVHTPLHLFLARCGSRHTVVESDDYQGFFLLFLHGSLQKDTLKCCTHSICASDSSTTRAPCLQFCKAPHNACAVFWPEKWTRCKQWVNELNRRCLQALAGSAPYTDNRPWAFNMAAAQWFSGVSLSFFLFWTMFNEISLTV